MNDSKNSLTKFTNSVIPFLSIGIFIFYIVNNVKNNIYEILFIDERMLIDDIYNIWLVEDIYNRFTNITNQTLKNFLIVFIELAYGGDLRYGRLWSNLFTILVGPFTLINDTVVILLSRFLNSLLFFSELIIFQSFLSIENIYGLVSFQFTHLHQLSSSTEFPNRTQW